MSAQSSIEEIKTTELPAYLAEHPDTVLFILSAYDTSLDQLMEEVDAAFPEVGVRWMANGPQAQVQHGRLEINRNVACQVVVYCGGEAVVLLICATMTMSVLVPQIRSALTDEVVQPSEQLPIGFGHSIVTAVVLVLLIMAFIGLLFPEQVVAWWEWLGGLP